MNNEFLGCINLGDNLFVNWLKLAKKKSSQKEAIALLNARCGTKYSESLPSKMKGRGFSSERIPTRVRRYMMDFVLRDIFPDESDEFYKQIIISLT